MKILRVFNNNVVLSVRPDGTDVILTGKGLGFQAKPGDVIDPQRVSRTYIPDAGRDIDHVAELLAEIPQDYVELASDLLHDVPLATVLALADHVSMAVRRIASQKEEHPHPLTAEVQVLYPEEYLSAKKVLLAINAWLLERDTVQLPESEATSIALHLVNAGMAAGDLADTYLMTGVISQLFDILDSAYETKVDRASINAARFITHLRYLLVRVRTTQQLDDRMNMLYTTLEKEHPKAVECAKAMTQVLQLRLDAQLTADELTYLALHIVRLVATEVR